MKKIIALIFIFLCLIANSLYAATWEDFKANAKDAKFVYQHFFMDRGSIAYEFEYMLDANPQSVFITDRKSKLIKPALRNLYIDIGTQGKQFGDKGFEVIDEADKAFVLDFLFAFAEYKEIYDTLKFFGKELSTPPTKDHPENMQERTYKHVEEMLKENKEKRFEKLAKFSQNKKEAVDLAIELIQKLNANTRFTQEDELHFFGGCKNFYSNTFSFYRRNGYIEIEDYSKDDLKIEEKKTLPPYSFFGETLRLNRNILVEKHCDLPLISVVEYYTIDDKGKAFSISTDDIICLEIYPRIPNAKKVLLSYFTPKKFFIDDIVIEKKELFNELKSKNAKLEETMHAYVLSSDKEEPKLEKFTKGQSLWLYRRIYI